MTVEPKLFGCDTHKDLPSFEMHEHEEDGYYISLELRLPGRRMEINIEPDAAESGWLLIETRIAKITTGLPMHSESGPLTELNATKFKQMVSQIIED